MNKFILILALAFSTQAFAGVSQIRFDAQKLITAGDMSAASINSTPFDLDQFLGFTCQAVFTGSPNGTLKIQVSDDIVDACSAVVNWTDYSSSSYALAAAGNYLWNVSNANYRCIRVVYTKSSGTGALTVTCGRKK